MPGICFTSEMDRRPPPSYFMMCLYCLIVARPQYEASAKSWGFWHQFDYFIAGKLNTDEFQILLGQMQLFALPAAPSGGNLSAVDSSWASCEPLGRGDEINVRSVTVLRTMEGGNAGFGIS